LVSFANKEGFDFTVEELKEVSSGTVTEELSLDELGKVAGGSPNHCKGCPDWKPDYNICFTGPNFRD